MVRGLGMIGGIYRHWVCVELVFKRDSVMSVISRGHKKDG